MVAFERVSERREEWKEAIRIQKERAQVNRVMKEKMSRKIQHHNQRLVKAIPEKEDSVLENETHSSYEESDLDSPHTEVSEESFETTESEPMH